jgi:hypothetical protein
MTDKEQWLLDYTDLNWSQFGDLRLMATRLEHARMNGARRFAMKDMVDEQCELTAWGREVLQRGTAILEEGWAPVVNEDRIVGHNQAAQRIRAGYGVRYIYAVHVKLLDALWRRPGLCYKGLCGIYGSTVIDQVHLWGLAYGERKLGAPWDLKVAGVRMMEWARRGQK